MRQRRPSFRHTRRHPALAAVALVALAPMLPAAAADEVDPAGTPTGGEQPGDGRSGDEQAGDDREGAGSDGAGSDGAATDDAVTDDEMAAAGDETADDGGDAGVGTDGETADDGADDDGADDEMAAADGETAGDGGDDGAGTDGETADDETADHGLPASDEESCEAPDGSDGDPTEPESTESAESVDSTDGLTDDPAAGETELEAHTSECAADLSTDDAPVDESHQDPPSEDSLGDEPVGDEPVQDPPAVDEPAVDEPVVDEPAVDEPVVDEPAVDEPVVDEPAVDEPAVDEPAPEPPVDPVPEERVPAPQPPADPAPVTAEADAAAERGTAHEVDASDVAAPAPTVHDSDGATPPTEEPAPDDDPGLRAERYDGVYAQGVPVWVAMTATRHLESRGNYDAEARGSTASGAYQVIDSTWNGFGGYRRAVDAPPAVQDQFAYESMVAILKRFGNDVSSIPVAWYYPAALRNPALMDVVPVPEAGNVLTPRQYQARWMAVFHQHLEAGSPVFLPADTDPLIPAIAFPVLGPTSFWDDWHAPRDGGLRRHEGLDFMGENGQPLRAAFDGVVTRIRPANVGRPGLGITITRDDGVRANYFHLDAEFTWHPDLEVGDTVKAGQVIAFMGDTGNAGVPHLHFELRTEDGEPIAPYAAALEAVQREQCSVGIGPWSTAFSSPLEIAEDLARAAEIAAERARIAAELRLAGLVDGLVDEAVDGAVDPAEVDDVVLHEVLGPDGARWTIGDDGSVTAWGVGALVAPDQGECEQIPEVEFGTGAAGLSLDLLPEEWWGDDVDPEDLAAMIAAVEAERSEEFDARRVDPSIAATRLRIGAGGILAAVTRPSREALDDVSTGDDVGTAEAAEAAELTGS